MQSLPILPKPLFCGLRSCLPHLRRKIIPSPQNRLSPDIPHANDPSRPTNDPSLHHNTRVAGNTGPELGSLLADGTGDGRALHLALGVDNLQILRVSALPPLYTPEGGSGDVSGGGSRGLLSDYAQTKAILPFPSPTPPSKSSSPRVSCKTTYHTGVVLEVKEDTVEALPGLGLADDDSGVHLLPEFRLALLDCGHHHVADTASGQPVEASTDTLDGDDVEIPRTGVVRAVHDSTAKLPLAFGSDPITAYVRSLDRWQSFANSGVGGVCMEFGRTLGDPGSS